MSALLNLPDFGVDPAPEARPTPQPAVMSEEGRLQAYEEGYKAGWDDAAAAHEQDQKRVSADFARNLSDLSFTYHEARGHVLGTLEPLLKTIVDKVMPSAAAQGFAELVVEEALTVAREHTGAELEIIVSPENRAAIEHLLDADLPVGVTVSEEPAFGAGQASLRFLDSEKEINLEKMLSRMTSSVNSFFAGNAESTAHG